MMNTAGPTLASRMQLIAAELDATQSLLGQRVTPWIGVPVGVAMVHLAARWAADTHWLAESVVIAAYLVIGAALLFGFRRRLYARQYPANVVAGLWLITLFMWLEAFATLSCLADRLAPGAFDGVISPMRAAFVDFYFFVVLDSVPALKLPETLALSPPPLHPAGPLAGVMVLGFRTIVVATLLTAMSDWWRRRRTGPERRSATRPGGA